jgi:hypothetical protein
VIEIVLTQSEMVQAAIAGALRHYDCAMNNRPDRFQGRDDENSNSLARHVMGAGGEAAVARLLGLYWGGHVGRFNGEPDLGGFIQVRLRWAADAELIVRQRDHDNHAFVLVTGLPPRCTVRGWLWGGEAKRLGMRAYGEPPAFFVKQELLRPMSDLQPPQELFG